MERQSTVAFEEQCEIALMRADKLALLVTEVSHVARRLVSHGESLALTLHQYGHHVPHEREVADALLCHRWPVGVYGWESLADQLAHVGRDLRSATNDVVELIPHGLDAAEEKVAAIKAAMPVCVEVVDACGRSAHLCDQLQSSQDDLRAYEGLCVDAERMVAAEIADGGPIPGVPLDGWQGRAEAYSNRMREVAGKLPSAQEEALESSSAILSSLNKMCRVLEDALIPIVYGPPPEDPFSSRDLIK